MDPTDSGYLSRPNKRARASGSLSEPTVDSLPQIPSQSTIAGDDRTMGGVAQHLTSPPAPNLALGPSPVAARTRGDDRSRKLSCKECRR